jgi:hypothetical protein
MSTVQLQVTKLYQRIDPRASDGSEITIATVGTVDGEKFTAAKGLAIYNDARTALANAISVRMDPFSKRQAIADNTVWNTTFTFTAGVGAKETGYIEHKELQTSAGVRIAVLPAHVVGMTAYLDSALNPLVYERGTSFYSVHGNLYIPDAATYLHVYYGITPFVIGDVTGGATVETFSPVWEPLLLELGESIAMEMALGEVNKLAMSLVGGVQ